MVLGKRARPTLLALFLLLWPEARALAKLPRTRSAVVEATAYNSHPEQTGTDPTLSASGVRLEHGMRAIAVSPDLVALGLVHGKKVRIEGLPGEWVVRDRMPARWKRRIDVYMGDDLAAARKFGRRRLRIHWQE